MAAYTTEGWSDFLVAAAGASAALAGLVFVGISINLARIIAIPGLPARAGQTIVVLANALALSLVALAPTDSRVGLGLEILVVAVAGWLGVVLIQARTGEDATVRAHRRNAVVLAQLATLPFIVCGVSVLTEGGGGLYWMQAGVILSLLVGLGNGWVLLVEILR
jgi:modulator of FtsH protease